MRSGDYLLREADAKTLENMTMARGCPIDCIGNKKHYEQLKAQNEQLVEALRKCSPGIIACRFCYEPLRSGHKDNCDYVRLTGGDEQ